MRILVFIGFVLDNFSSIAQQINTSKTTNISKVNTLNSKGTIRYIQKVENLYILEKSNIPSKDNFSIEYDSLCSCIIAKPKEGIWENPFFGYPYKNSTGKGNIIGRAGGSLMVNSSYYNVDFFGMNYRVMVESTNSLGPSTPSYGYAFQFKKFPLFLEFGDLNDTTKWYTIYLKNRN